MWALSGRIALESSTSRAPWVDAGGDGAGGAWALLPTAEREPVDGDGGGRAVGGAVPRLERAHNGGVLPAERVGAHPGRARPRGRHRRQLRPPVVQRGADPAVVARAARA